MQNPTTSREALTMVAELLADPTRWIASDRFRDARNAAGQPVDPLCPTAVAWTLDGALARIVAVDAVEEGPEWCRRTEIESGAYRALGIAPGSEFRQLDTVRSVLRHGEKAAFKAELRKAIGPDHG